MSDVPVSSTVERVASPVPGDVRAELARCDAEIAAMLARPGQPAWLVALGVNDWEYEKKLIVEAGMKTEQIAEESGLPVHDYDKKRWPKGPWDSEPDRAEFVHAGFACLLVRGPVGAWCGYVGVPESHPAFGKGYDDVDVEAHGGLTYANFCTGDIRHVPKPGMPDKVWWLGFDCAHLGDAVPGCLWPFSERFLAAGNPKPEWDGKTGGAYRDIEWVREETKGLARRLKKLAALSESR